MILIYGKVPGSFEICPGKVGNFLSSCREVKSAHAILSQEGHPCSYISKILNEAEPKYSTSEKELLAIV